MICPHGPRFQLRIRQDTVCPDRSVRLDQGLTHQEEDHQNALAPLAASAPELARQTYDRAQAQLTWPPVPRCVLPVAYLHQPVRPIAVAGQTPVVLLCAGVPPV